MINFFKKYKRKIIQLTFAILYNINFRGLKDLNIYKGNIKILCTPGLNCYSCPAAIMSCPLGALQQNISSNIYSFNLIDKISFYVIGMIVLFGVIFGRVICGFLCPFGLIQELIYKIKSPKIFKNKFTSKLIYCKYVILFIFVIIIPFSLFYPAFCKYICPVGTLEAGVFFVVVNEKIREAVSVLFIWKLLLMIFILAMSIFIFRFFCRFICPLGALYGFFNKVSILGLKIDKNRCNNCNVCINTCYMDVRKVGDMECIQCGDCINKCKQNAIKR